MKKDRTCKYCNILFKSIEGKVFSNHVRWCPANKTNGDKGRKALSKAASRQNDLKYGKKKWYTKTCKNNSCFNVFKVYCHEISLENPKIVNQCCSKKCAASVGGKLSYTGWNSTNRKRQSIISKKNWDDPKYRKTLLSKNKKIFTSKGELEIREHFKKTFPYDSWTHGGSLKFNNQRIIRDLYSNTLKVCIEYDGIWHFKDIKGQLISKQLKDKALHDWCLANNYRLIRIDEDLYKTDKKRYLNLVITEAYNGSKQIVKLGIRY
jgi:very-short-patch-repair endonuclease